MSGLGPRKTEQLEDKNEKLRHRVGELEKEVTETINTFDGHKERVRALRNEH
jgi:hypothetical protein